MIKAFIQNDLPAKDMTFHRATFKSLLCLLKRLLCRQTVAGEDGKMNDRLPWAFSLLSTLMPGRFSWCWFKWRWFEKRQGIFVLFIKLTSSLLDVSLWGEIRGDWWGRLLATLWPRQSRQDRRELSSLFVVFVISSVGVTECAVWLESGKVTKGWIWLPSPTSASILTESPKRWEGRVKGTIISPWACY